MKQIGFVGSLMVAASAFGAFSDRDIAFYPFRDGEPGVSAVGVSLTNAVGATYPGRVVKFGNGDVKFSDENPGEYLFAGLGYRSNGEEPYYTNPGSLYFEGSASGTTDSCQLFFDDIARELAALGDAGTNYSIEFYYKIDDGYTFNSQTTAPFLSWRGNWKYNKSGAASYPWDWARVYLRNPLTEGSSSAIYAQSTTNRADSGYVNISGSSINSPAGTKLADGKWHHFQANWPPTMADALSSAQFVSDHRFKIGNGVLPRIPYAGSNGTIPGDEPAPIVFNEGRRFKGWISCVRVRKVGLPSAQSSYDATNYLYASSLATCEPRTVSHVRFEGNSLTNCGPNYATSSPAISHPVEAETGRYTGCYADGQILLVDASIGKNVVSGTAVDPVYSDDVPKAFAIPGKNRDVALANAVSLVMPGATDYSGTGAAYGPGLTFPYKEMPFYTLQSSYTVEFFFKFDCELWAASCDSGADPVNNTVRLAWMNYGGTSRVNSWALGLDVSDMENPKFVIYSEAVSSAARTIDAPKATDGKWHHVAVSISEPDEKDARICYDYKNISSVSINVYTTDSLAYGRQLFIGSGNSACAFPGRIDEVRVSHGFVPVDDLLHASNLTGMLLLVR